MAPAGNDLRGRLAALRRRLRFVAAFRGVAWLAAVVLSTFLVAGLLDWRFHLPGLVRGVVLAGLLAGTGVIAYRLLFRPLSVPVDDLSLALRVEERYPALNDALASTVQFLERGEKAPEGESASMRREAVNRTLGRAAGLDFLRVVEARGLWKLGLAALLALAPVVALSVLSPANAGTAAARLALPFSGIDWPRKTRIELEPVVKRIGKNREYRLRGVVKGVVPKEASLELTHEGFPTQRRALAVRTDEDGESSFVMQLRPTEVHRTFRFRLSANDATTPEYTVEVLPLPGLTALDGKASPQLRLDVPRYTDLPTPVHLPPGDGNIDAVTGTAVTLKAAADRPLRRAWVEYLPETTHAPAAAFLAPLGSAHPLGVVASFHLGRAVYLPAEATIESGRKRFTLRFRPALHGSYALKFEDENDLVGERQFELRLRTDLAPTVRLDRPSTARDMLSTVLPTAELPLQLVAEDTLFAVRGVWLEYRVNTEAMARTRVLYDHERGLARDALPLTGLGVLAAPAPRLRLPRVEFNRTFPLKAVRHLDGSPLKEGDVVVLQACADDFDEVSVGKEPGRSTSVEIRIVGRSEFDARINQEQGQVQQDLKKLHEKQREALKKVAEVEARLRKGGKMSPEREALAAEEQAKKAREEAADEEARADKAEDEAEKKKHREKAEELRKKAEEEAKKADELRKQAQQLAEAEEIQQQISRKVGDEREGLRADIERLRQTLRQNGMEHSAAMDRMTSVARELDRLADKELQQIEPKLATARKLDEMQDEQTRKERMAELEQKAKQAEQEARAEEERAKKLGEQAARAEEEAAEMSNAAEAAKKQAEARNLAQQARQAKKKAEERAVEAGKIRKEMAQPVDPARPRRELAEARRGQEEVEKSLGALLQDLEPWSSTREVKGEAAKLLQDQKELEARAEELEKKGLTGKSPEELAREEKAELDDLQEAQKRLEARTADLVKKMKRMAADRAEKDPETAREMLDAANEAEQGNLAQSMREAEARIGQNKLNEARKKQREAVAELEKLSQNLEARREAELDRLGRKLREAEKRVEELMDEQEKLQRKMREAEKIKDPREREAELKRLARKQQELREKTQEVLKQLSRLRSGRAQQALGQAAEEMADADKQLLRGKGDDEKQEDVLDRLDEARMELRRAAKKAEEELGREQVVRVADVVRRARDRQQGLMQEATRIAEEVKARKGWSRGLKASLRDLGQAQKGLGEETESVAKKDLTAAPVFRKLLQRVARNMNRAGERFGEMVADAPEADALPDADADRRQRHALEGLQKLLDSLKEQAEQPRPLARNGGGGGGGDEDGGGGGGGGDDSLPPSAQLKLLRSMQKEVNDKTREFREKHPDAEKLTDRQKAELQEIRREQKEVADLLEQLTRPAGEPMAEENGKDEKEGDDR